AIGAGRPLRHGRRPPRRPRGALERRFGRTRRDRHTGIGDLWLLPASLHWAVDNVPQLARGDRRPVRAVRREPGSQRTAQTTPYGRWLPARSTTTANTVPRRSGDQAGVETVNQRRELGRREGLTT